MNKVSKEILDSKWGEFDSLEGFARQPLQDGRFSLELDRGRFECLYLGAAAPERLFVLLSGARDPKRQPLPKFDRWSWRAKFPGAILCVSDPTLYLDEATLRIGWYLGTREHDWMGSMARLVRAVAARLDLPTERVVSYGSSAGGFASLVLSARLGDSTAVAINPQTNALRYFEGDVNRLVKTGFGVESAQDIPTEWLHRFSAMDAIRTAPASRCMVVQNLQDGHHYRKHYLPWCEATGAPAKGGVSMDGRFRTIIYESPDGHGPEPREMVDSIVSHALALSVQKAVDAAPPMPRLAAAPTSVVTPITSAQIYLLKGGEKDLKPDALRFSPPGRPDVAPYPIEFPLDWDIDPYHDRNWCGQLHMWRMMDDYLLRYERLGDKQWLDMPLRIMDDWHRFHVRERSKSRYAWMDMMVGLRAMKLAYVLALQKSGILDLSAARIANYRELVDAHLEFLLDPANVAFSNHTFFDLHGAMALGQVVDSQQHQRIKDFVGGVLPRLLDSQFNQYGLHLEHSPEYHPFGIKCLQRLQDSKWFDEYGVGRLLSRALAIENWLKLPDGRMAPIGDSNGAAMAPGSPTVFRGRNQVLNNGGYVIVRDDGGSTCAADASYLFFMGAFHSRFHKQPDDLSFIWFEGEDILCDAGKYAYKSDANRDYVLSTRAHNTVEIDQKSYWDGIAKDPSLIYGSAIENVSVHEWGHLICARVNQPRFAVKHARFLLYAPGSWVFVIDRLSGQAAHQYTQWFHFAPHIAMRRAQPDRFEGTLATGRKLSVRNQCSGPATPELVRGQKAPRMQGWTSQKYREIQENDALGFSASGKDVLFATLLTLDDAGSSVSMAEGQKIALTIKSRSAAEKLVVTVGEHSCRIRKR